MERDFTPAYYQIKLDLKEKIKQGKLAAGEMLPGRKTLCDTYGCSWGTLNRAVNELILEGVLRAEKGKGTYIVGDSQENHVKPELINVWLCHPFPSAYSTLSEMMDGMREEAHRRGCSIQFVNLANSSHNPEHLDQYIVVTPSNDQWEQMINARERGDRFVVLNASWENPPFPCIDADIFDAVQKASAYMLNNGHRHIGLIGIREGFSNYDKRVEALSLAYKKSGMKLVGDWIVSRPENRETARALYSEWLDHHTSATALFAADYWTAMILFELLTERGLRVPDDLSLFTVGAPNYTTFHNAAISTIVQPFHEMGRKAIRRLLDDPYTSGMNSLTCDIIKGGTVAEI